MGVINIGGRLVGEGHPVYIIAEVGINHNGDLDIAKSLIHAAKECGADAVKFQKRTVEVVYTSEELQTPRETPFGSTNGDYKYGVEFGKDEYDEIDRYCSELGIQWFASCWDEGAVDFIESYDPPCYKIASASLTDDHLLRYTRSMGRAIILSTGGSTEDQINHATLSSVLGEENLAILHCNSMYPCRDLEKLNLGYIHRLMYMYSDVPIGYSGHEVGIPTTEATVALGAKIIERHITLDRSMWGSDQSASVELVGFEGMVRHIRGIEKALGPIDKYGSYRSPKIVYPEEVEIMKKLRRVG